MTTRCSNRYRSFLFISVFAFISGKIFPQAFIEPSRLKQFNITVNSDDHTIKTQMLSQEKKICLNNERVYMWYTSQKIMETRGGFDGKLIHGTYRAFYLNNQLKEKGNVKYGLRNKEWKYWYPDGRLKEVINWKNGEKNGRYELYNDYGQLMAKSNFRKDKLDGNFYTYNSSGKVLEKKKYRRGEEVVKTPKTRKSLWERLAIRKKPKTAQVNEPSVTRKKKIRSQKSEGKKPSLMRRYFKKDKKKAGGDVAPVDEKRAGVTS